MSDKITFVLPLKSFSKDEYDICYSDVVRAKLFLLPSCKKFVDKNFLEEFLIIVSANEFEEIKLALKDFKDDLKISFIIENELEPEIFYVEGYNWYKQQLLKLAVSKRVKTSYYFTLDSDMMFTRHISENDFFCNGKPFINFEKYKFHYDWWVNTSKLLKYPLFKIDPELDCPGCTPVILKCEIINQLINKLQTVTKNKNCFKGLLDLVINNTEPHEILWTEYSLYWLFIMNELGGIEKHYHIKTFYNWFVGPSIWHRHEFDEFTEESLKEAFNPKASHFIFVVQSIIGVELEEVIKKIKYFFIVTNQ